LAGRDGCPRPLFPEPACAPACAPVFLATLQQIRAIDVQEIRYLSATEATTPYGTGHVGGVIEVTTRR
jgi:hypothetical protein